MLSLKSIRNKKHKKRFQCVKCFYICNMEDKKGEIIEQALGVYMELGIKSVTMDEMARQLGVSKKTIYLYVKDKNDLVEQTLNFAHENEQQQIKINF